MQASKGNGQVESFEALMDALGVLSFCETDFDRAVAEVVAEGSFLGRGDSTEFLSVVMRWRRFFMPSALYGHHLGAGLAILSRYPFAENDDLLVTDRSRVTKNAVIGKESAERIREAKMRNVPVIAFFGGSTIQGYGARLPQFSIPAQVERILEVRHGRDVVCLNYGVVGWTCVESLCRLIHEVAGSMNIAVFYDGWNCCNELYLLSLAARSLGGGRTLSYGFPDMSLRDIEKVLEEKRQFSAARLGLRSFRLCMNQLFTWITNALRGPRIRRLLNGILNRYFSIAEARLLREKLDKVVLSADEELSVVKQVAQEYIRTHDKIARWCSAYQIRRVHALQPLLPNSRKRLSQREEDFRRSGLPWGRPHVPALFRREVHGCPGMVDLSDVFDNVHEEVFVDAGHLNIRGNFHVALRLADLLAGEMAAMDSARGVR